MYFVFLFNVVFPLLIPLLQFFQCGKMEAFVIFFHSAPFLHHKISFGTRPSYVFILRMSEYNSTIDKLLDARSQQSDITVLCIFYNPTAKLYSIQQWASVFIAPLWCENHTEDRRFCSLPPPTLFPTPYLPHLSIRRPQFLSRQSKSGSPSKTTVSVPLRHNTFCNSAWLCVLFACG